MRLELRDIAKTYPSGRAALAGLSLTFEQGLHGLLGPNGAGKTTLMKIMATLLEPSRGQVLVDGRDVAADRDGIRRRLGYLGQDWGAPRGARCSEVLDLVLGLRGMSSAAERRDEIARLLHLVGLEAVSAEKAKALSGGMLRRLGVAQALAGSPELIIMDEPTVGLDPSERVEFRRLLVELGRKHLILLSTHIVMDVGSTCQSVAVLDQGRVLFDGSPHDFATRAQGQVFEIVCGSLEEEDRLRAAHAVVSATPTNAGVRLRLLAGHGQIPRAQAVEPRLEDAYLLAVGAAGGDEEAA